MFTYPIGESREDGIIVLEESSRRIGEFVLVDVFVGSRVIICDIGFDLGV